MLLSPSKDSSDSGAPWLPIVASVLAGVVTAAWACPGSFSHAVKPGEAALRATVYVGLVGGITGAVARLYFSAFFSSVENAMGAAAFSCAGNGVWLAPIAIFVAQQQSWSVLGAALLGLATARVLWRYCTTAAGDLREDRQPVRLFAAVVAIEAGVFALADGRLGAAAALTGAGCFLVASAAVPVMDAPPGFLSRRPRMGFAIQAGCAIALATLALVRIPDPASRPGSSGRHAVASGRAFDDEDLLSGVILTHEVRRFKLVAPVRNERRGHYSRALAAPPAGIEFSGEYWILSAPMQRPPRGSLVERATPITRTFTAVDRSPILMQARQRLPSAVDSRCCSAIEVAVRSTDKQPETIALGLYLADSTIAKSPIQRLGVAKLPPRETAVVSFRMPPRPVVSRFDEIVVDIYLSGSRRHRSANIAIQRFVLVPRVH